ASSTACGSIANGTADGATSEPIDGGGAPWDGNNRAGPTKSGTGPMPRMMTGDDVADADPAALDTLADSSDGKSACSCSLADAAGGPRWTSLDCLCRWVGCGSGNYDTLLAQMRSDCSIRPPYGRNTDALFLSTSEDCGLLGLSSSALDSPHNTWFFD